MNSLARRFIALVVVAVAVAAAIMAPRRQEWLAVLRDENQQAQIIALLEPRLAQGGDDPQLLAELGRSHAEIGNHRRAAELLERYVALRPEDGDAFAHLADQYKALGEPALRLTALRRAVALQPRMQRVMELAGLHRQDGQAGEERALLAAHEGELPLESGLLLRLARLHMEAGAPERALEVLSRAEILAAAAPPAASLNERLMLTELLIGTGRAGEAVVLGRRWIGLWREPWMGAELVRIFAADAPLAETAEIAEAVARRHPEVRFFLSVGLAKAGAGPAARHLLAGWSAANPAPPADEIAAFLTVCREQDARDIVWRSFAEVLRRGAADDVAGRFAEAIVAEFGIGALAPFWAELPAGTLRARPLLAARLAFQERDMALARVLAARVDPRALGTGERRMWLDLLRAVAAPEEVFAVLRAARGQGRLPADLAAAYAQLAGGLGREAEYRAALAELRGDE